MILHLSFAETIVLIVFSTLSVQGQHELAAYEVCGERIPSVFSLSVFIRSRDTDENLMEGKREVFNPRFTSFKHLL